MFEVGMYVLYAVLVLITIISSVMVYVFIGAAVMGALDGLLFGGMLKTSVYDNLPPVSKSKVRLMFIFSWPILAPYLVYMRYYK